MYVREGQIWQGFITPCSSLECVEVLEVKEDKDGFCIIGFADKDDVYFLSDYDFERKFEYKV